MYFQTQGDGTEYRLAFRYNNEPRERTWPVDTHNAEDFNMRPLPGVLRTITEKWVESSVSAIVYRKVDGPPPNGDNNERTFHWERIATATTHCSRLDQYSPIEGREYALAKLEAGRTDDWQDAVEDRLRQLRMETAGDRYDEQKARRRAEAETTVTLSSEIRSRVRKAYNRRYSLSPA